MSLVLLQSKIQARDHRTPKNAALGWPNMLGLCPLQAEGSYQDLGGGWLLHMFLQAEWTVELRVKEQVWRLLYGFQAEDKILMRVRWSQKVCVRYSPRLADCM